MNGPLRKISVFVAVLMFALLANLTYFTIFEQNWLRDHAANRRLRDQQFSKDRGAILVENTAIALSEKNKDPGVPFRRSYPDPELWASVTGWFTRFQGTSGLERSYNNVLAGDSSNQALAQIIDTLSGRPLQGANVVTGLSVQGQKAAMEGLGDKTGAVVAMNYATGQILVLASTPSYDPNGLADPDSDVANKQWQKLLKEKSEPLKNRALREVYPPGSTFKLITAAVAVENGIDPRATVKSPSSLRLPNSSHSLGNSTNCGGETTTLEHALAVSCNTAFANLGIQLGAEKMKDMAQRFGFNEEQTIDLPAATSRYPSDADAAQTAQSAIGQYDVAASPLQMAQVVATIANDGKMMKPYVVDKVLKRDLQILQDNEPTELRRPISSVTAKQLQHMMIAVVEEGTGRPGRISDLTIGGKTGTAQSSPERPPYAWFVGFATEPKVAIAVFVEDANMRRDDISGGRVAAPIFKSVMEALR